MDPPPHPYKFWMTNLRQQFALCKRKHPNHQDWKTLDLLSEKCTTMLPKYPQVWLLRAKISWHQKFITKTRIIYNLALQNVSISQHEMIWAPFIQFALEQPVLSTTQSIFERYIKISPLVLDQYVSFLLKHKCFSKASQWMSFCLENPRYKSAKGKSKSDIWIQYLTLLATHSGEIQGIDPERVFGSALILVPQLSNKILQLYSEYFIRLGKFNQARHVFDQAMNSCISITDFTFFYSLYLQLELNILQVYESMNLDSDPDPDQEDILERDYIRSKITFLLDNREHLVNTILRKQNPNNIFHQIERLKLEIKNPNSTEHSINTTFWSIIHNLDIKQAIGPLSQLWIIRSEALEKCISIEECRKVLSQAQKFEFSNPNDALDIWLYSIKYEIRNNNYDTALKLYSQITSPPSDNFTSFPHQKQIWRNPLLWQCGFEIISLQSTPNKRESLLGMYQLALKFKTLTISQFQDYIKVVLQKNTIQSYTLVFSICEKVLSQFPKKYTDTIVQIYFKHYNNRLEFEKNIPNHMLIQHGRELYQNVCSLIQDPQLLAEYYLNYAQFEKKYGLLKNSMAVFAKASQVVQSQYKRRLFIQWIKSAGESYGITHTRPIFDKIMYECALKDLPYFAKQYAKIEISLGQFDLARQIFLASCEKIHPEKSKDFWTLWEKFELEHGNSSTFSQMKKSLEKSKTFFSSSEMKILDLMEQVGRIEKK